MPNQEESDTPLFIPRRQDSPDLPASIGGSRDCTADSSHPESNRPFAFFADHATGVVQLVLSNPPRTGIRTGDRLIPEVAEYLSMKGFSCDEREQLWTKSLDPLANSDLDDVALNRKQQLSSHQTELEQGQFPNTHDVLAAHRRVAEAVANLLRENEGLRPLSPDLHTR